MLVVRDPSRGWSDPAFYTLAAGSLGLQLGGQVSETVFTVMNDRALNALIDNQFKFGGDISVAAGPSGKRTGSSATTNFGSDVYSFAFTEGLFGGVSFEGAGVLQEQFLEHRLLRRGRHALRHPDPAQVQQSEFPHAAERARAVLSRRSRVENDAPFPVPAADDG